MVMDPFAAALDFDSASDQDTEATLTKNGVAHSLEASGGNVICIDAQDDTDATLGKRKAPGAQPRLVKRRKRNYEDDRYLKLSITKHEDGAAITCVFLPYRKNDQLAIPLLPQYEADWGGAKFGGKKWLVISSQTQWLQMVFRTVVRKKQDRE